MSKSVEEPRPSQTLGVPPEREIMQLATVLGHATATVKHPTLAGWRMLVVQPLDARDGADGHPIVAIDSLGSRRGDRVMITSDGKAVRELLKSDQTPVRWTVIGLADE